MPTAASFTRWNMQSAASPGGTRPGWSGPAAVLIAGALTGSGVVVDAVTGGVLGWGLRIGFVLGVTCAVVMVRREGCSPRWCSRRWCSVRSPFWGRS